MPQQKYLKRGEKVSKVGTYDTKKITIELNPEEKILLYIGEKTHNIKISLPGCHSYILSEHKTKKQAEKKVKEFDKKLKKGCLIRIIDDLNAEITN